MTLGYGGGATLNFVPSALESAYGSRTPLGALIFIRLRPYHSPHMEMQRKSPMMPMTNASRQTRK